MTRNTTKGDTTKGGKAGWTDSESKGGCDQGTADICTREWP